MSELNSQQIKLLYQNMNKASDAIFQIRQALPVEETDEGAEYRAKLDQAWELLKEVEERYAPLPF